MLGSLKIRLDPDRPYKVHHADADGRWQLSGQYATEAEGRDYVARRAEAMGRGYILNPGGAPLVYRLSLYDGKRIKRDIARFMVSTNGTLTMQELDK